LVSEWLCDWRRFETRRILSRVLHERKSQTLRGNSEGSSCDFKIIKDIMMRGGPGRDRTDDLFHAMEARSQLRHRPTSAGVELFYSRRAADIRQTRPKRKGGRSNAPAAGPSLGGFELTAKFAINALGAIATAWSLPAARCWPAPARRFRSGSESRTSTCSWWPPRNPWPEPRSAPKERSPAACSSPG
jgi:hypothetical protein